MYTYWTLLQKLITFVFNLLGGHATRKLKKVEKQAKVVQKMIVQRQLSRADAVLARNYLEKKVVALGQVIDALPNTSKKRAAGIEAVKAGKASIKSINNRLELFLKS